MLNDLEPGWLWMIGGVLLLAAEIIAPGFFLVWVGTAAIVTGIFAMLFGIGTAGQFALFALYAVIAVYVARRWYIARPVDSEDPALNDRMARLQGRVVTVVEAIDAHNGRVRVGDGEWSARGGPAAPGDKVRITGVDGNCLNVEPERSLPPA
ncbi:MAG: NfeD family protein [Pseudomonadota bacterium]|nr:NfeD family protein [Pseudomonadota bacterium]